MSVPPTATSGQSQIPSASTPAAANVKAAQVPPATAAKAPVTAPQPAATAAKAPATTATKTPTSTTQQTVGVSGGANNKPPSTAAVRKDTAASNLSTNHQATSLAQSPGVLYGGTENSNQLTFMASTVLEAENIRLRARVAALEQQNHALTAVACGHRGGQVGVHSSIGRDRLSKIRDDILDNSPTTLPAGYSPGVGNQHSSSTTRVDPTVRGGSGYGIPIDGRRQNAPTGIFSPKPSTRKERAQQQAVSHVAFLLQSKNCLRLLYTYFHRWRVAQFSGKHKARSTLASIQLAQLESDVLRLAEQRRVSDEQSRVLRVRLLDAEGEVLELRRNWAEERRLRENSEVVLRFLKGGDDGNNIGGSSNSNHRTPVKVDGSDVVADTDASPRSTPASAKYYSGYGGSPSPASASGIMPYPTLSSRTPLAESAQPILGTSDDVKDAGTSGSTDSAVNESAPRSAITFRATAAVGEKRN